MIKQAKAIGIVISPRDQKIQRHDVYCTKIAPMIRPSTEGINQNGEICLVVGVRQTISNAAAAAKKPNSASLF